MRAPRLALTLTGPKEEYLGQPLSYQVTVKNLGDAAATRTRLRLDATPGQAQFVSAQAADGARLSSERQGDGQDLGAIAPGESRDVTVIFQPQRRQYLKPRSTATRSGGAEKYLLVVEEHALGDHGVKFEMARKLCGQA